MEIALEAAGIPHTILRPNTFMQSYVMNADTIKRDQTLFMPMGNGKVGLIDVRDIAAVAVACLTEPCHEGKKYVLTGPEALSNFDVAEKLTDALGKRVVYADVSPLQSEEAMKKAGMPAWQIRVLLELFQICKDGYAEQLSPAVEQILKRKPITFDEFLAENLTAFRESGEAMQTVAGAR